MGLDYLMQICFYAVFISLCGNVKSFIVMLYDP